MHPDTMVHLANLKIADELAWAERQRRARIARGASSPDAVSFEGEVQHLSFAARVKAAVAAIVGGERPRLAAS